MKIIAITAMAAVGLSMAAASPMGNVPMRGGQPETVSADVQNHAAYTAAPHKVCKVVDGPQEGYLTINETPEGTLTVCVKEGEAHSVGLGIALPLDGAVCNIVRSDNGKIYMKDPVFYIPTGSWIEGTVEGDIATFTFPQLMGESEVMFPDGHIENTEYYTLAMKFVVENEETGSGWLYPTEQQTVQFRIDGTTLTAIDPEIAIGMNVWKTTPETPDTETWVWTGEADAISKISEITYTTTPVPDGVEMKEMYLTNGWTLTPVSVGRQGDDFYFRGLFNKMPDGVVKGQLRGNTLEIPSGQYMGIYEDGGTTLFFDGGTGYEQIGDGLVVPKFTRGESLLLTYDSSKNVFMGEGKGICFTPWPESIKSYDKIVNTSITGNTETEITEIREPRIFEFYDAKNGNIPANIFFEIPLVTSDFQPLDTSKLYWNVIVDATPFEYTSDYYMNLDEPMVNVPYTLDTRISGIFDYGNMKGTNIYSFDYTDIGVRLVYTDGDKTIYSPVCYAKGIGNGIPDNTVAKEIHTVEYYDMQGHRVINPERGIYIQHILFKDGTSRTAKICK